MVKKMCLLVFVILCVLSNSCIGKMLQVAENSATVYASPSDNLKNIYVNLKNSGQTFTATNRGRIVLGPGTYTQNLTMDQDYIDLVELIPGTVTYTGDITVTAGDAIIVPLLELGVRTVPAIKEPQLLVRHAYDLNPLNSADYEKAGTGVTWTSIEQRVVLEDCENAWTATTNVTAGTDGTTKKIGTYSAKFIVADAFTTGLIGYKNITSVSCINHHSIAFYVRSSVTVAAGDLQLVLDDTPACASPIETINIGAITANNWIRVAVRLTNPSLLSAVVSVGIKTNVDLGSGAIIYVDQIEVFSDYVRTGTRSIKATMTSDTPATAQLFWDTDSTAGYDLRNGCSIRVKFYANYPASKEGNHNKATLFLYNAHTISANYGALSLPAAHGWNEIEVPVTGVSIAGSFTLNSPVYCLGLGFGNTGVTPTEKRMMTTGDFVVFDSIEVVRTGSTKAYVIVQLDDATKEQFTEMAPYAASKGIPIQIYVAPELVGKNFGSIEYATWEDIRNGYESNVLLGVHSQAAIGLEISNHGIEEWCKKQKKPFIDRGLIRGSDYMALPGGQLLSLRDENALRIMQKYFVSVRGTASFYQEGGNGYLGTGSQNYNNIAPKDYVWSSAMGIDSNYATYINKAIAANGLIIMYTHGTTEYYSGWPTTRALWREFIDYLATKVADGSVEVVTLEDVINGKLCDTSNPIKKIRRSLSYPGGTGDFTFSSAANTTEQVINFGPIIPANARLIDIALINTSAAVFSGGATTLVAKIGSTSSGSEYAASASIYALGAILAPATGTWPQVNINAANGNVYVSATPGANWSTMIAGRWVLSATYIENN